MLPIPGDLWGFHWVVYFDDPVSFMSRLRKLDHPQGDRKRKDVLKKDEVP